MTSAPRASRAPGDSSKGGAGRRLLPWTTDITHVSRTEPEAEGAAEPLTLLDGLNSDRRKTLPHQQPATHANTLQQQQQALTEAVGPPQTILLVTTYRLFWPTIGSEVYCSRCNFFTCVLRYAVN